MISSVDRRSEYVENRAGANVRLNNFLTPYTLDDKSSILNAPCGYSNGVYPSLRPVKTFGSELVPSIATIVNAGGGSITQISQNSYSSISDGTSPSTVRPKFDFATTSGKTYKLVINPIGTITGTVNFDFYDGSTYLFQNYDFTTTKEITFTDNGTVFGAFDGTQTYNISNFTISIKEVIDADFDFTRGSAATRVTKDGLIKNVQILSGDLVQNGDFEEIGPEKVTNGDFATDSNWNKYSNATISGGKAILTGGNSAIAQVNVLTVNTNYVITYSVLFNNGSSSLTTNRGGSMLQASGLPDAVGTHTVYVKTSGSGANTFFISNLSNTSREIHIDNVSVKEVGQNWEFTDGWSIENGKANIDTSQGTGNFNQLGVLTVGKKYRLSLSAAMTVGRVKFQSDAAGVFIFSSDVSN
ncbi:hypothetical protein DRO61_12045, partial [Candidatus Bathyarchaeota archaeon]